MSRSSQEILHEGWLTKSPPTKRIWRGRWRRRWFSLQYGELPGQLILVYYTDRNCRKVKGVIDLEYCEQVDTGLKLDEGKLKFDFLFDIKTPQRTYYLAADTEAEMKAWVKSICSVCHLRATSDEDEVRLALTSSPPTYLNTLGTLSKDKQDNALSSLGLNSNNSESAPLSVASSVSSTVSTSPYIPISECITGRSPVLPGQKIKDFQALLQHNMNNSFFRSDSTNLHNDTYENTQLPQYLNFNSSDPRFYDFPRLLQPPPRSTSSLNKTSEDTFHKGHSKKNSSPLQSPTDSESVFEDDDWSQHATSLDHGVSNPRPSDSSVDLDLSQSQKLGEGIGKLAPPRPPKPAHIAVGQNYFNLPGGGTLKETKPLLENRGLSEDSVQGVNDDMYDFPRSHQVEAAEMVRNTIARRHCYNNAAPGMVDGQIFNYDISPKQVFSYDIEGNVEEPASPRSQTSSTAAYSNLPSPLLPDTQLMSPPAVNRGLKPKRKLSDSLSICSSIEPQSPRLAPSVDRKLKPTIPAVSPTIQAVSKITPEDIEFFKKGNSSTLGSQSHNLRRSHDSLLHDSEPVYSYLSIDDSFTSRKEYHKLEYLDLDLDNLSGKVSNLNLHQQPQARPQAGDTVYKKVDFMKTEAFNITRNNLEKERETLPVLKK